jgi:hypothetical protein
VYKTADCSGFPLYYTSFSGGSASWSPTQTTSFYLRAFCSGFNSDCKIQQVSSVTAPTTTTLGGYTGCKKEGRICTDISPCCSGLVCVENACRNVSSSTTTIVGSTTTLPAVKTSCPYDCCQNDPDFYDKQCNEGYVCQENLCIAGEVENSQYLTIFAVFFMLVLFFIVLFFILRKN